MNNRHTGTTRWKGQLVRPYFSKKVRNGFSLLLQRIRPDNEYELAALLFMKKSIDHARMVEPEAHDAPVSPDEAEEGFHPPGLEGGPEEAHNGYEASA